MGRYSLKCPRIKATFGVGTSPGQGQGPGEPRCPSHLPQPLQGPELAQMQDVLSQRGISHGAGRRAGEILRALKGLPETWEVWRGRAGVRLGPFCLRGPKAAVRGTWGEPRRRSKCNPLCLRLGYFLLLFKTV